MTAPHCNWRRVRLIDGVEGTVEHWTRSGGFDRNGVWRAMLDVRVTRGVNLLANMDLQGHRITTAAANVMAVLSTTDGLPARPAPGGGSR